MKRLATASPGQAFDEIYRSGMWSSSAGAGEAFCSGIGSRDVGIVEPYVKAVRGWLARFGRPPAVVDLGCGDYHVGSQIRDVCGAYVACDCVAALVDHNRLKWAGLGVDFRVHDATREICPEAEVVFIRQVLQHLSNDLVQKVLTGITGRCDWVVVTEHIPVGDFTPNVDKPLGAGVRLYQKSGVVVTEPPFSLQPQESQVVCDVIFDGSRILTTAYRLR